MRRSTTLKDGWGECFLTEPESIQIYNMLVYQPLAPQHISSKF